MSLATSIDFGTGWRARLKEMGPVEKSTITKKLAKAHTLASDVLQEMDEDRRFFDSIPALRRWGASDDSTLQFHIELLANEAEQRVRFLQLAYYRGHETANDRLVEGSGA